MFKLLISMFSREAIPCSGLPTTRPSLEELESRLTPAASLGGGISLHFPTYTAAIVQVTPNLFSGTVTETITAIVTSGFGPVPSGKVLFNLNNQSQSAQLNSNGQATASFTMPILALLTSQTLNVNYTGGQITEGMLPLSNFPSEFLAPLYMNFDNLLLPATLSFGHLTQQQSNPTFDKTTGATTGLPSFDTAQGETDNFGIFSFLYTDPGTINQVEIFGLTLPGLFAAQLGAYGS